MNDPRTTKTYQDSLVRWITEDFGRARDATQEEIEAIIAKWKRESRR